jgi:hypothetical protein
MYVKSSEAERYGTEEDVNKGDLAVGKLVISP